jgi:hypothetical protein
MLHPWRYLHRAVTPVVSAACPARAGCFVAAPALLLAALRGSSRLGSTPGEIFLVDRPAGPGHQAWRRV